MIPSAVASYRPSLRLSLGCLLVALVVLTAAALGLAAYATARNAVFEGIRDRLRDAVAVGALLIDADAHAKVRSRADEDTPEYRAVRAQLQRIRDRCQGCSRNGCQPCDGAPGRSRLPSARVRARRDSRERRQGCRRPRARPAGPRVRRPADRDLETALDRCPQVRFVYTLRQAGDGQYAFFVDAEEKPEERSHVGDLYDGEPCAGMQAAFTPPYRVQLAPRLTTADWGVRLTSYAPLFTRAGEFEGVLAMDMSAAIIGRYERRCRACADAPPPADWGGVTVMDEK